MGGSGEVMVFGNPIVVLSHQHPCRKKEEPAADLFIIFAMHGYRTWKSNTVQALETVRLPVCPLCREERLYCTVEDVK